MDVKRLNVKDLRIARRNVRKHPQKQIDEIKRSFEMFGQYRPLVVTHDGECLVGNGFLEAMMQMGVETVECIVLPDNVSEEYKHKIMLADNKIFDLGTDAISSIDEILSEMQDFDIPGFDEDILSQLYSAMEEDEPAEMSVREKVSLTENQPFQDEVKKIKKLEQEREDNPPEDDSSKYEVKESVVQMQERGRESSANYITCPHCGCKIYGYN